MNGKKGETGMPTEPGYVQSPNGEFGEGYEKRKMGKDEVGDGKVYTLAYADDVVLTAEEEKRMRSIIEILGSYLERKELELNAVKSKIMRFRKGGRRKKKMK